MSFQKPRLSFWQIWNMNVGFFGIQFSFGLQQSAINPIFSFLGAEHSELPLLNLAGPVTGLIIQPLIGAISDRTWSPKYGRRKPFFMIGAILASLCLFVFPFSPTLWFAAGLLWILDAANNTALEPYRAFIGDQLPDSQLTQGFQMQSLFVGAGITAANFSLFFFQDWFGGAADAAKGLCTTEDITHIPKWVYYSFFLGAFASLATVLWSVIKTPEYPPDEKEMAYIEEGRKLSFAQKIKEPFIDIYNAILEMPTIMWQLSVVYLFQWYALFIYWQYLTPMLRNTFYGVQNSDYTKFESIQKACKAGESVSADQMAFAENIQQVSESALAQTGLMNGTYNFVTMLVALILVPIAAKYGNKKVYVGSLLLTGIGMLSMPYIHHQYALLIPMILLGIGWATMMGIPYSMVTRVIPEEKRGVYMGIVNMMIVIPMLIETVTFGPILKHLFNDSAVSAIICAGVLFILAAIAATRLSSRPPEKVVM